MKKTKFTESQIIGILKEQIFWHGCSQLKRMKELEQELSRYKRMYAELAHDNYIFKLGPFFAAIYVLACGSHGNLFPQAYTASISHLRQDVQEHGYPSSA